VLTVAERDAVLGGSQSAVSHVLSALADAARRPAHCCCWAGLSSS
jgi:hypothetical protein